MCEHVRKEHDGGKLFHFIRSTGRIVVIAYDRGNDRGEIPFLGDQGTNLGVVHTGHHALEQIRADHIFLAKAVDLRKDIRVRRLKHDFSHVMQKTADIAVVNRGTLGGTPAETTRKIV